MIAAHETTIRHQPDNRMETQKVTRVLCMVVKLAIA